MNVLDEYRDILRLIDSLEESLYLLDAKATRCTTHISDEIRCPALVHDRMAEIVVQKVELSNRIDSLIIQLYDIQPRIYTQLKCLDEDERAIVIMRYIDGMPWKIIADRMHRPRTTCYDIMQTGVRKIATSCGNA